MLVHIAGFVLIVVAGGLLVCNAINSLEGKLIAAVIVYVASALASNLASFAYHFSGWHGRRMLLRRIDHAAIYPSITGTFTPFFVHADTAWTLSLLAICWVLSAVAIWKKIFDVDVQSRWSMASYLGLGAIGLSAVPDLTSVPQAATICVLAGAFSYVLGTVFYARRTLPYRYAIWHAWVNLGGALMFAGIWMTLL